MLVLTRKLKEAIEITTPNGDVIKLTNLSKYKTKIGIEADFDFRIKRSELGPKKGQPEGLPA